MKKVKVVKTYGVCKDCIEIGREGIADYSNVEKTGNIMFYSKEGQYPYRICLKADMVQEID